MVHTRHEIAAFGILRADIVLLNHGIRSDAHIFDAGLQKYHGS